MTQGSTDSQTSRLETLQVASRGKPLCVFPGVHEVPASFRALAERLGDGRSIYAFKHIGSAQECEPVRQVSRLAQLYAAELRAAEPHAPYYLLGHGIGGVIAFEVARELDSQGQKVGLVIMADCPAPGHPKRVGMLRRVTAHVSALARTPRTTRARYVRAQLRETRLHVTELLRMDPQNRAQRREPRHLQRVTAALYEAYRHYRPSPQCVDVLFMNAEQPSEWQAVVPADPLLGWGPALRGRITHWTQETGTCLFAPAGLEATAERIDSALVQAELRRKRLATPLPAAG
jgi:thioesterase domain-containing protein